MDKRKRYADEINNLIRKEGSRAVEDYLTAHSGLPAPGMNLELASVFADYFAAHVDLDLWLAVRAWARLGPDEAPADSPEEFLSFCALQAFGAVYGRCDPVVMGEILNLFAEAVEDPRPRIREAAAIGLRRVARQRFDDVFVLFKKWVQVGTPLAYRAVAATLAEPDLLSNPERARAALWLSGRILHGISHLPSKSRQTAEFHTLVQVMGRVLSTFVMARPEEGFALLENWAARGDRDIVRIIRENLTDGRLAEAYRERVAALRKTVDGTR